MGKELRCPGCDRAVDANSLGYSRALKLFVCPECRAKEQAVEPEEQSAAARRSPLVLPLVLAALAIAITALGIFFASRVAPPSSQAQRSMPASRPAGQSLAPAAATTRAPTRPAAALAHP